MTNLSANSLTIEELISGNLELCSPPEVFLKVDEALKQPKTNAAIIAEIIQHDPGLTARLLKLANSPLYGYAKTVLSVEQAVNLLGHNNLKNLVLATTIITRFTHLMPHGSSKEYWSTSIQCALFAKDLCQRHSTSQNFGDVFICGLLHDIGLLVLFLRLPELTRAVLMQNDATHKGLINIEQQVFGFDHFGVGAALCRSWGLPDMIPVTMEFHKNPMNAPEQYRLATAIVSLAHQLAQYWNESDFDRINQSLDEAEALNGIQVDNREMLWVQVKQEFDKSFKLFF